MKKYIVLKKVITDEFVFVEAEDKTQAKGIVMGGKGKYQGTQYAGELPASCWEVTELTEDDREERTYDAY